MEALSIGTALLLVTTPHVPPRAPTCAAQHSATRRAALLLLVLPTLHSENWSDGALALGLALPPGKSRNVSTQHILT